MTFTHTEPVEAEPLFFPLADLNHHAKYLGAGGQGRSEFVPPAEPQPTAAFVPSPVDVVSSDAEPIEYLDAFGKDSCWYAEIQAFKKTNGIQTDAPV